MQHQLACVRLGTTAQVLLLGGSLTPFQNLTSPQYHLQPEPLLIIIILFFARKKGTTVGK